jgi:hypothetical protein
VYDDDSEFGSFKLAVDATRSAASTGSAEVTLGTTRSEEDIPDCCA